MLLWNGERSSSARVGLSDSPPRTPTRASTRPSPDEPMADNAKKVADNAKKVADALAQPVQHSVQGAFQGTDWRKASGRTSGKDGYKFGDLSRSLVKAAKDKMKKRGEDGEELEGDEESASVSENPVSTVVRFGGQVFGATKGLAAGAALGAVKGGVALTDKLYEASSSKVASEQDRARFNSRIGFAVRSVASEVGRD